MGHLDEGVFFHYLVDSFPMNLNREPPNEGEVFAYPINPFLKNHHIGILKEMVDYPFAIDPSLVNDNMEPIE